VDFSLAQRNGFINAFVHFWMSQSDNTRTENELREAAERLLRGCREHFRAGVTRVGRISAVVSPERRAAFTQRALGLLDAADSDDFIARCELLVRDFPKIEDYIDWWRQKKVAMMLFPSERQMDVDTWDSLPQTTNAEESMHRKFYQACGRDHDFETGLQSLVSLSNYYERLFEATTSTSLLFIFRKCLT